jgi:hypothetical protein
MNVIESLIQVELEQQEDFLKIKETLTRIGVASKKDKTLYQSCHILHKQGLYYIVHFKELFMLDGKPSNFSDEDRLRRNTIATLLEQGGLLKIKSINNVEGLAPISQVKILSHKEKDEWELVAKYNIGRKR